MIHTHNNRKTSSLQHTPDLFLKDKNKIIKEPEESIEQCLFDFSVYLLVAVMYDKEKCLKVGAQSKDSDLIQQPDLPPPDCTKFGLIV